MVSPKYSIKKKILKKIPDDLIEQVESEIKAILHAGRDCYRNQRRDTSKITWVVTDGYYGEAFGIMRCLQILGYGYFGSSNLDALEEAHPRMGRAPARNITSKEQNINWWISQLQDQVLDEEGYGGDNRCEYCLKKYHKDAASILEREAADGLVEAPV